MDDSSSLSSMYSLPRNWWSNNLWRNAESNDGRFVDDDGAAGAGGGSVTLLSLGGAKLGSVGLDRCTHLTWARRLSHYRCNRSSMRWMCGQEILPRLKRCNSHMDARKHLGCIGLALLRTGSIASEDVVRQHRLKHRRLTKIFGCSQALGNLSVTHYKQNHPTIQWQYTFAQYWTPARSSIEWGCRPRNDRGTFVHLDHPRSDLVALKGERRRWQSFEKWK